MRTANHSEGSGRFRQEHPEEANNDLAPVTQTPNQIGFQTRSANQEEHRTVLASQAALMAFVYLRQSTLAQHPHCRPTSAIAANTYLVSVKPPHGQLLR
jgi:hypothetical protein